MGGWLGGWREGLLEGDTWGVSLPSRTGQDSPPRGRSHASTVSARPGIPQLAVLLFSLPDGEASLFRVWRAVLSGPPPAPRRTEGGWGEGAGPWARVHGTAAAARLLCPGDVCAADRPVRPPPCTWSGLSRIRQAHTVLNNPDGAALSKPGPVAGGGGCYSAGCMGAPRAEWPSHRVSSSSS